MTRTFSFLALVVTVAGSPVALAGEAVSATKLKSSVVDCYPDETLDGTPGDLTEAEFSGPRTASQVRGRALEFKIGSRSCWVDRGDVEIDGLPRATECVSSTKALANRGVGNTKQCQ